MWAQTLDVAVHQFRYMTDLLYDAYGTAARSLESMPFHEQVAYAQKLRLATGVYCLAHRGLCAIPLFADLFVAGTPCPDLSKLYKNRMDAWGPRGWVIISWVKIESERGTKLLLHENVAALELW